MYATWKFLCVVCSTTFLFCYFLNSYYRRSKIPHQLERETKHSIRVWKPLPCRRVLKTLKGSLKVKTQRGQYLLAVDLSCYLWYQSQTPGGVPTRTLGP